MTVATRVDDKKEKFAQVGPVKFHLELSRINLSSQVRRARERLRTAR